MTRWSKASTLRKTMTCTGVTPWVDASSRTRYEARGSDRSTSEKSSMLVLLDQNFEAFENHEAQRMPVIAELISTRLSCAQAWWAVSKFKEIGKLRWSRRANS